MRRFLFAVMLLVSMALGALATSATPAHAYNPNTVNGLERRLCLREWDNCAVNAGEAASAVKLIVNGMEYNFCSIANFPAQGVIKDGVINPLTPSAAGNEVFAPCGAGTPVYQPAPYYPSGQAIPFGVGATVSGGNGTYINGQWYCNGCTINSAWTTGYVINGNVFYPNQSPMSQTTQFYPGALVSGGTGTYINGQWYCNGCTFNAGTGVTGYVIGGNVSYPNSYPPQYPPSYPPSVYNPCPSGGTAPYCTVNGMSERASVGTWTRINQGEAAYGDKILLDNGRACTVGNCAVDYASSAGWVYNGWVNPLQWRLTGYLVKSW